MSRLLAVGVMLAAGWPATAQVPRVSRPAVSAMEQSFDRRIITFSTEAPFDLFGTTRGVYLDGYGAVFTTEVNLMHTETLTPFRLTLPKDYVTKVHEQKLQRVPVLERIMREAMLAMAASLDVVPPTENIVLAVSLVYYHTWEDTSGLPSQIIMRAERQKLLDVQLGRASRSSLDSIIRMQEL